MKKMLNKRQISRKIRKIAKEISKRHKDSQTPVVFIGLLNGAFMFYSDLIKELKILNVECDFIRAKSYNGTTQGELQVTKYIETSLENKHVYVVDDIYDSGITMKKVIQLLSKERAKSITPVTLLKRSVNHSYNDDLIYGFMIEDEWVVGYGMDGSLGRERNLTYIKDIRKFTKS